MRLRGTPRNPVHFTLDDTPYVAEAGDTLAVALWAAGQRSLTRSPKYHRPRGPFCLRGQCEGCLLRVQGAPNTMACTVPVEEGMRAFSQNYLGAPQFDLLRATDWMFPSGMNHHEFLAGLPVAEDLMKAMARRIAGLGTLPDNTPARLPAVSREVDVLVIGAGTAGRRVHAALDGMNVACIDFVDGVQVEQAAVIGVFGPAREVVAIGAAAVTRFRPRALVFATGSHDQLPPFENNDLPGIVSLRAAQHLAARGVAVGLAPLLVETPEGSGLGRAWAAHHGVPLVAGTIERASGLDHVREVVVRVGDERRRFEVDALVIDGPRSAAYELVAQAGAQVVADTYGFRVQVDDQGRAGEGIWAVGSVTGQRRHDDEAPWRSQAETVAAGVRAALY